LELNETFTKINLWKQTQFNKIVYLDADILPIVPPDELFEVDAAFAVSSTIVGLCIGFLTIYDIYRHLRILAGLIASTV